MTPFLYPIFLILIAMNNTLTIFDFNKESNISNWVVIDDVVMGGRSNGSFSLNAEGHGVFEGAVSLENNGGFSSLRYQFEKKPISKFTKICIRLKGDGKKYQLRLKPDTTTQFAYTTYFQTTNEWQTVKINLGDLIPTFRGRVLAMDNYDGNELAELGFLIGNKKNEAFQLIIDSIFLE